MDKTILLMKYNKFFVLEMEKIYKFPDFTLEYVSDYQDPVPENFPNKGSGLFRGKRLLLKSDQLEKEIKESIGSGIMSNRYFVFNNKEYSILLKIDKDKGLLRSIVEGKAPKY